MPLEVRDVDAVPDREKRVAVAETVTETVATAERVCEVEGDGETEIEEVGTDDVLVSALGVDIALIDIAETVMALEGEGKLERETDTEPDCDKERIALADMETELLPVRDRSELADIEIEILSVGDGRAVRDKVDDTEGEAEEDGDTVLPLVGRLLALIDTVADIVLDKSGEKLDDCVAECVNELTIVAENVNGLREMLVDDVVDTEPE